MKLLRLFALVGIALANPAQAQTVTVTAPNTVNPSGQPTAVNKTFIVNPDGSIANVSGGGGGGGSVDTRVAQGSTTAGQTGSLVQGAVVSGDSAYTAGTTQPFNLTATGRLKVGLSSATNIAPAAQPSTTLASDLVGCVYRTPIAWTTGWNGALQCDANGNLMVSSVSSMPSTGVPGATAPAYAQQVGGAAPGGLMRPVSVDSRGGLTPAQGVATTTRTALPASTATLISAAATSRIGLTVQIEAALTANTFLCTTQATACSATSYDALIPSGAGAGTTYTFLFAPSTALYAFTTGTPVVVANSWVAP